MKSAKEIATLMASKHIAMIPELTDKEINAFHTEELGGRPIGEKKCADVRKQYEAQLERAAKPLDKYLKTRNLFEKLEELINNADFMYWHDPHNS